MGFDVAALSYSLGTLELSLPDVHPAFFVPRFRNPKSNVHTLARVGQ